MDCDFISPLPFEPNNYIEPNYATLGEYSLSECVYIFWSLKSIRFTATAKIQIGYDDSSDIMSETDISEDIIGADSGCVIAMPPQQRALATPDMPFAVLSSSDIAVSLNGPYYARDYDESVPFEERKYIFFLSPFIDMSPAGFNDPNIMDETLLKLSTHKFGLLCIAAYRLRKNRERLRKLCFFYGLQAC